MDPSSNNPDDILVFISQENPIKQLHQQFEAELKHYQHFWDVLDELDKNTWVLEPEAPSRSCTHRRLALGQLKNMTVMSEFRKRRKL